MVAPISTPPPIPARSVKNDLKLKLATQAINELKTRGYNDLEGRSPPHIDAVVRKLASIVGEDAEKFINERKDV